MLHLISRSNVIYRTLNPVSGFLMFGLTLIGLITLNPSIGFSQEESDYDEISVFLNVQRVGGAEVAAVIRDETVFLPVVDIFSFLKIKADPSEQLDSVTGFFINQPVSYTHLRAHETRHDLVC